MKESTKEEIERSKNAPLLTFGKYKGVKISQVPMSYLRWMLGQKFPPELMKFAWEKVRANKSSDIEMEVTRHAYDSFSLRYIGLWQKSNIGILGKQIGIGTFLAELADHAWKEGKDVSMHRHQDEEIRKEYQGVKFVFNRHGYIRTLITIM